MKRTTFFATVTLIASSCAMSAQAQSFDCKIDNGGGVELWGTNPHPRVIRCEEVKCTYWKEDGTEGYEKCKLQMQPNSSSTKYCYFNRNNAKQVIGVSHSCT
jgi:hypothetical protein